MFKEIFASALFLTGLVASSSALAQVVGYVHEAKGVSPCVLLLPDSPQKRLRGIRSSKAPA